MSLAKIITAEAPKIAAPKMAAAVAAKMIAATAAAETPINTGNVSQPFDSAFC